MKLFVATKAFIFYKGKMLIIRESKKYEDGTSDGLYDVVGGRVELGQSFDESLLREIKKESSLEDIKIGRPFFVDEWRPTVGDEEWQIVGIFFECESSSDDVKLSDDHDKYEWIVPKEHKKYMMIPSLHRVFETYLELKK